MTDKIGVEEMGEYIESPCRYEVIACTALGDEQQTIGEASDRYEAHAMAERSLRRFEAAKVFDRFEGREDYRPAAKRLVMRRAQLQGHPVVMVEVAS